MKKLAKLLALAAAVLMFATGCKKLPEFTQGSSSGGGDTPTTGGTLYYRLNGDPVIGSDYISISAKYDSKGKITEMWLLVSESADMPAGSTHYADIQMNYPELSVTLTGLEPSTNYFWCINYLENENSYTTDPVEFMTTESLPYSELIIGRWKTSDGGHYEVYNNDGTGKMWDPKDDVMEDEADTFEWSIEGNKLTLIVTIQGGQSTIPQYCNIITLNETTFVYNNEGWRAEYSLIRETGINFSIYPNTPEYQDLNDVGGWVYLTGGNYGLIVYRLSIDEFMAYDRMPMTTNDLCPDNRLIVDIPYIVDECNSQQYNILNGYNLNGDGSHVYWYQTEYDGTTLRMYN